MKRGLMLMVLVLAGILVTGIAGASAEEMKYVDVGDAGVQLNGDFSAEITIGHAPGKRLEGGMRFYVNDRDYYLAFIRWETDIRCDFYVAKYVNGAFLGFIIPDEYAETKKDCYVSLDESWDASYDSGMKLRVSVRDTVATITMTGLDTGLSGTLHFDLTQSACLNKAYTEATPKVWQSGMLKSGLAKTSLLAFTVDEYTKNGQPVIWPPEKEEVMRKASDFYTPGKYTDENGVTVPYQIHLPENMEEGKTYPMILFMHGAGLVGSDNVKVVNSEEIMVCNTILEKGPDCIILAPQTPSTWMSYPDPAVRPRPMAPFASFSSGRYLECALSLMQNISETYPVDTNRIYYYGYSMGAITGWYVLATHPDTFAAAILCAGVGFPEKAEELAKTPLYIFHGTVDDVVSYDEDLAQAEGVRQAGGEVVFKSCAGYGHGLGAALRSDPDVVEWLFSKTLK